MFDLSKSDLLFDGFDISPMFPENPDISLFNNQLERLNIDVNTQSFQITVERIKRQKLHAKFKRVKRELIPKNKIIGNLQYTVTISYMRENWLI